MTSITLTAQPARAIRELVRAGIVPREVALAHAMQVVARYTAQARPQSKITKWTNLASELAGVAAKTPAKAPVAARPKAEPKPQPVAYAQVPAPTVDVARARELFAKKIMSNEDRAALDAMIVAWATRGRK